MHWVRVVGGGIFIDWECSKLTEITEGCFIPIGKLMHAYDTKDEFRADLLAFLNKWFPKDVIDPQNRLGKDLSMAEDQIHTPCNLDQA